MKSFKINNEPVTGKGKVALISNINLTLKYQENLVEEDGTVIMEGKERDFQLGEGRAPVGAAGEETKQESAKKKAMLDRIAELFAEYLNS